MRGVAGSTKKKTLADMLLRLQSKYPDIVFHCQEPLGCGQYTVFNFTCADCGKTISRTFKDLTRTKTPCDFCAGIGPGNSPTTEEWIQEMRSMYSEEAMSCIDVSRVVFAGATTRIVLCCNLHKDKGEYHTTPARLRASYKARGNISPCKWCNIEARAEQKTDTLETFKDKIPEEMRSLDSFEESMYVASKLPMAITCLVDSTHGPYYMRPNYYLLGSRCPKCRDAQYTGTSRPEKELLRFCCSLPVNTVAENVRLRNGKDVDILLPELNIAIEFHGDYWHSEERRGKHDMVERAEYANSIGIKLLQIMGSEWEHHRTAVEHRLKHICAFPHGSIMARKTYVQAVPESKAKEFLTALHTQGNVIGATCRLALVTSTGSIVAVATFGPPRNVSDKQAGFAELYRFASSVAVSGGLSKLISAYFRLPGAKPLITYADLRWGSGDSYRKCGFSYIGKTEPGYFWSKSNKAVSRWSFTKKKLSQLPEFSNAYSDSKSEAQICSEMGYSKVWDAGNAKFIRYA